MIWRCKLVKLVIKLDQYYVPIYIIAYYFATIFVKVKAASIILSIFLVNQGWLLVWLLHTLTWVICIFIWTMD